MIILLIIIARFNYKKYLINKEQNIDSVDVFFVKDKNNKYALFNDKGSKLTGFNYTDVGDFVGGTTVIEKDKQYSIISSNGKTEVEFGKYNYIKQRKGIYEVLDKDNNKYLINGKGKILYNMKDILLDTYGNFNHLIVKNKISNTYNVINPNAKNLLSIPITNANEKLTINNEKKDYVSLYYNGINYIMDSKNRKKIISFNSDKKYCINYINNDKKVMVLNSCMSEASSNKVDYKIINNGKLIDIDNECENISILYESDDIICEYDNSFYFLDKDFKRTTKYSNMIYKDLKNYAKNKNKSFSDVGFYKNDKLVKNVPCRTLYNTEMYSPNEIYLLTTYSSESCNTEVGTYEFYNSDGKKMFNKSFKSAYPFDNNKNAVVTDSKKEKRDNYYLIDIKGNKISRYYDSIENNNKYYIVTKNDLKGIVNENGEEVIASKYNNIYIYNRRGKVIAELINNSKKTIYNLTDNKKIISTNSQISLYEHYILIDDGNKYYSYLTGKVFYESNK